MVRQLDDLAEDLEPLLCTRCAARDAGPSGFCVPCLGEHTAENYIERDVAQIDQRRESWRRRTRGIQYPETPTASAVANRERQRRHRLLEAVRPKEPAPPGADPFELAKEAILVLHTLRGSYRRSGMERLLPEIDRAEELVRQLAWGPTPLPERREGREFYRAIAEAYREAAAQGKNPATEIVMAEGVARKTVQGWIYRARKLGFLEKPAPPR